MKFKQFAKCILYWLLKYTFHRIVFKCLKIWANLGLCFVYCFLFTSQFNYKLEKRRCCALDLNHSAILAIPPQLSLNVSERPVLRVNKTARFDPETSRRRLPRSRLPSYLQDSLLSTGLFTTSVTRLAIFERS